MPKIQNMGSSTPVLVAHPTRDALAADAVTRILDISLSARSPTFR